MRSAKPCGRLYTLNPPHQQTPATYFAAVSVFAGMRVTVFLVPRRSLLGTYFSRDRRARSGFPSLRFDCGEE